jgi:predicted glycoside hydrolase/deacetylase ChbG (UPF0249 family)
VLLLLCASLAVGLPTHVGEARATPGARAPDPVYLVIRTDDAGMSHSVNVALERLIATGLPLSVSVMPPTPWFLETVELLERHPAVSVGVHLTLNSEWRNYRWGPVSGRGTVPSLVDADGYFFQSGEALLRNSPDLREVETELRAQLDRAIRSGLRIDYVDYHMGTAVRTPELREVAERLARERGLAMSEYFGETQHDPQYRAAPRDKDDSLVAMVRRLEPGLHLVVTHVGIDDAELGALVDMNTEQPLADMSDNRQAELDALTSRRFRKALEERDVRLLTYRQLMEMRGPQAMRRPGG